PSQQSAHYSRWRVELPRGGRSTAILAVGQPRKLSGLIQVDRYQIKTNAAYAELPQILFQKIKVKDRHRIRFAIQRVIVLCRKLVAMIALNRNPFDRLELFDVSNANPVRPVLRIQAKDGGPRRQITQFHSSREWMNVHRCI